MNDPKKRIDVNLSSLLSLKAELVRKREEAKNQINQPPPAQFHHHKLQKPTKSMPPPISTVSEFEDQMLFEKSKKVLESKSKFYEKMVQSGGSLNSDENSLVMFNQKKQECTVPVRKNDISSSDSCSSDSDDSDEDYAEFTDCLGRTRRCLKKDLEKIKTQDRDLSKNMTQKLDTSAANWMINIPPNTNPPESVLTDNISIISKHETQKMDWEKKEEENVNKPDIHYQDVFFNEARQHGTAYYAFSTDTDERKKQQQALDDMRKKTLSEQKDRESQKIQREKIIAARVRAAKNRQRARLGLPPLEDDPTPEGEEGSKEETREERKQRKKDEKRKRRKENEESARADQRKNHVRPWDYNKDSGSGSSKWQYKPDVEPMSQDQWNEMKRNERNSEFAPPNKLSRTAVENSTYEPRYHPDKYQMLVDKLREEKTREEKPLCIPPESFVPFIPKSYQNHFNMDIDAKLKFIRQNGPNAEWKRKIGPPEHTYDNEPPLFSTDLKYRDQYKTSKKYSENGNGKSYDSD
ncbi:CCDC174 family protein [Megaselia abdita]